MNRSWLLSLCLFSLLHICTYAQIQPDTILIKADSFVYAKTKKELGRKAFKKLELDYNYFVDPGERFNTTDMHHPKIPGCRFISGMRSEDIIIILFECGSYSGTYSNCRIAERYDRNWYQIYSPFNEVTEKTDLSKLVESKEIPVIALSGHPGHTRTLEKQKVETGKEVARFNGIGARIDSSENLLIVQEINNLFKVYDLGNLEKLYSFKVKTLEDIRSDLIFVDSTYIYLGAWKNFKRNKSTYWRFDKREKKILKEISCKKIPIGCTSGAKEKYLMARQAYVNRKYIMKTENRIIKSDGMEIVIYNRP